MSSQKPRPPTPAKLQVNQSAQLTNGNLYPVINLKQVGLNPYITAFKRLIAPINPFAHQQIGTSQRAAIGPRWGAGWYIPDTYPNAIHWQKGPMASHYDPLHDPKMKETRAIKKATKAGQQIGIWLQPAPRFCQRQVQLYKRCLVANDENDRKCDTEKYNILTICPTFALETMRQNNLKKLKLQALNNRKYRDAMEVGSYNQGRTVADVPLRSWKDGCKEKLRPDTLWVDDRYADITQKEIDEAKQRVKRRRQQRGQVFDAHLNIPHYNRQFEAPPKEGPLYH